MHDEGSKFPDGKGYDDQPKWRKDFPVDTERDSYVARRDFVKFLSLVSGAFVAGQSWILFHHWRNKRGGEMPRQHITAVDGLAVGAAMTFHYPDHHGKCLLVRASEAEFVAYNQLCSHLSCAVLPDVEHNLLRCPCHHGYFDLHSGRPLAGPPRRPLPRVVLEISDGGVYATGVEYRT